MFIIIIILVFAIASAFIISYLQTSISKEELDDKNLKIREHLLDFIKKCENELNEHNALVLALKEPLGVRILERNGFYFETLTSYRKDLEEVLDEARTLLSEKIVVESIDTNADYSKKISVFITNHSPLKEAYSNLIISCFLILRTEKEEFKYFPVKLHNFIDRLSEFKNEFITYYENITEKQFNEGDILLSTTNDYNSNKLFASLYRQLISNIEQVKKFLVENISESNYNSAYTWYENAYIEYFEFTEKFAELSHDINSFHSINLLIKYYFDAGLINIKNSVIENYTEESSLFLSLKKYLNDNPELFEKIFNEYNFQLNKTHLSSNLEYLISIFAHLIENYSNVYNLIIDTQKFTKNFIFLSNTELNEIKNSFTLDKIKIIQESLYIIDMLYKLDKKLETNLNKI